MLQLVKTDINNIDGILDRLQIVVLDCPYTSIHEPLTQKYFSQFMAAKLKGYQEEYPYGVLPFDRYDMIGTLLLLCEKNENGDLETLMSFKSTSMERCSLFDVPFELLVQYTEKTRPHHEATTKILESAKSRGVNVGFNSSWTIQRKARENRALTLLIRDLTAMMMNNYYSSFHIEEVLIATVVRFKVDKMLLPVGFDYLKVDETVLPPFSCPFLFGEQTAVMHLKEFSNEAKGFAQKYSRLWQNRIQIGGIRELLDRKKAA